MSNMDEIRAKFETEYCPPVEPALVYTILSDYDLETESGRGDATEALDQIREFAALEEAAGFDPSGTTVNGDGSDGDARTASRLEGSAASSRETDLSSVSNGLDGLDLSDNYTDGTLTPESDPVDLEAIDEDMKVKLLLEVFKDKTTAYNVRHTLQKCGGRWDVAMEELLSQVGISDFLQAEGGVKLSNKSIDAFAEENGFRRGKKVKGRKKGNKRPSDIHSSSARGSPTEPPVSNENRWHTASRDAELLADRTGLPLAQVQSIHNSHGASLPKTIHAILKQHRQKISQADREDPLMVANASDLQQDFPSLTPDYVFALVHLTHPCTNAAHQLATDLTVRPESSTGGIQIIPRYTRPNLDDADSNWQKPQKKSRPATPPDYPDYDSSNVSSLTSNYSAARATAYQQAQAAYRKSRSNPLMGGAAAYYSQQGRDLGALSFQATAKAANQLAAQQSTSNEVDLHGIDVLNAVRIAQERVGRWYASLGENRVNGRVGAESRQTGYRIVVGLGTHSVGGKGKLGPAVSKALKGEGWKIENNGAVILVRGR